MHFVANTASLISEVVTSPLTNSYVKIITSDEGKKDDGKGDQHAVTEDVQVHSRFKLVFITVVAITVFAVIAQIVMAVTWSTPTTNQQATFEAVSFAWKTGIGAIFGLLGGKIV